jgi:D-sedoheptulose 7-phosphate isomerase
MKKIIENEFNEHLKAANSIYSLTDDVAASAQLCIDCLKNNGKILLFGNGGSAADAQHIAAEIVGRYKEKRKALPAIALTTDSSALTAIGNDFGFLQIYTRQVEALANKGDILIAISTGGASDNVNNALKLAKKIGCKSIGFSGRDGGEFNKNCDINIVVPAEDTPRIQEMHILIGHTICHLIDKAF